VTQPSRREFLKMGGLALVGFGVAPAAWASAPKLEIIAMRRVAQGARVWFDPIGL
jgi:hypothetical protein